MDNSLSAKTTPTPRPVAYFPSRLLLQARAHSTCSSANNALSEPPQPLAPFPVWHQLHSAIKCYIVLCSLSSFPMDNSLSAKTTPTPRPATYFPSRLLLHARAHSMCSRDSWRQTAPSRASVRCGFISSCTTRPRSPIFSRWPCFTDTSASRRATR